MTKQQQKQKTDQETEVEVEHPTPDEAKQMFRDNPGLAAVTTTEGVKRREEVL